MARAFETSRAGTPSSGLEEQDPQVGRTGDPTVTSRTLADEAEHLTVGMGVDGTATVSARASVIEDAQISPDRVPLQNLSQRAGLLTILFSLVLLPMMFGGVHPSVFLSERIIVCVAFLILWVQAPARLFASLRAGSISAVVIKAMLLLAFIAACNSLVLSLQSYPHPVLGVAGGIASWDALRSGIFSILTFGMLFAVIRTWIGAQQHLADWVHRILLFTGFVVSLTALSHWFYDNGRLFWTFEPQNIMTSDRARWPFVNPNHLGHFLLPLLFLAIGTLRAIAHDLRTVALSTQRANKRSWKLLLNSSRVQHRLIRMSFVSILVLSVAMAIVASLSRGAWLGASAAIFLFLGLRHLSYSHAERQERPWQAFRTRPTSAPGYDSDLEDASVQGSYSPRPSSYRRRRKQVGRVAMPLSSEAIFDTFAKISRYSMPAFFLLGLALGYFFLFGRGSELFLDRLQYGLLYSHTDLRWQLYTDTLAMLPHHWLFGVGLGGWAFFYPQYADPRMSGMDPVYLHSDPYQLLVEGGVVSAAIMLGLAGVVLARVAKVIYYSKGQGASILIGLSCGLFGLLVASFVDFSFHIPSICSLTAGLLVLIAFYLDKHSASRAPSMRFEEPFSSVEQS